MKSIAVALMLTLVQVPAWADSQPVTLEVFFETMDSQGWQLFFMSDAVRRRLPAVEMKVYPLVEKDSSGALTAKRGETELAEAMRVAVVSRMYPEKLAYYLNGRSLSPWADGWRDAAIFAGISPDELGAKVASNGKKMLSDMQDYARSKGVREASALINGVPAPSKQKLFVFFDAVNSALPADKRVALPKEALARKNQKAPKFWIVSSSAAAISRNDMLVSVFEKYFENIKPVELDYSAKETAGLFGFLEYIPAYLIEASSEAKSRLESEIKAGLFKEQKGYLVYYDKQSKGMYPALKPEPKVLKLFVMSQCPYGIQAENALIGAMKDGKLPKGIKLEMHYIGESEKKADGSYDFRSLHGTAEWEENLRQLIIAKVYPDKLYDYLLERNKDASSTQWEAAAKKTGIVPEKIKAAFEEHKPALAEDFALANSLGVSSSPTFLWEGQYVITGLGALAKQPGFEKMDVSQQATGGCNR